MNRFEPEPTKGVSIKVLIDPPDPTQKINIAQCDKARDILAGQMAKLRFRFDLGINRTGGWLGLRWCRIGSTAGIALWKSAQRCVAATLLLNGTDHDDCIAIESITNTASSCGVPVRPSLLGRARDNQRPAVAIAFGDCDEGSRNTIVEFSVGLGKLLSRERGPDPGTPLGAMRSKDFPPRFFHTLIVNGATRTQPHSRQFRDQHNQHQLVTTFQERFEQSYKAFEKRIILLHEGSSHRFHVVWQGLRPTAGVAELTDSKKVPHTLILLSGTDPSADCAVIDALSSALPHFAGGLFESSFENLRSGPRPMLAELIGVEPDKLDPAAADAATALAVAFFRQVGVI